MVRRGEMWLNEYGCKGGGGGGGIVSLNDSGFENVEDRLFRDWGMCRNGRK